jgi:glycosyltransferase involved in cell wall biosynthesis
MIENIGCELIIVNNNCTDDTIQIAEEFWTKSEAEFPLIVVEEKTPGLSFARKAGVFVAQGEILVFCDDDNWLKADYAVNALKIMKSDLKIGVLGGASIAVSDSDFPIWFTTYQAGYAVGVQNIMSGYLGYLGHLWGAGMVARRSVLLNLYNCGFTSLLTDRKGRELSSGGDTEICFWNSIVGYKIYYSEELILEHFIEKPRLSIDYKIKLYNSFEKSEEVLNFYLTYLKHLNMDFRYGIFRKSILLLKFILGRSSKTDRIILEYLNRIDFFVFDKNTRALRQATCLFHEKRKLN